MKNMFDLSLFYDLIFCHNRLATDYLCQSRQIVLSNDKKGFGISANLFLIYPDELFCKSINRI